MRYMILDEETQIHQRFKRKGVFNLMLLSDAYEFGALMGATSYAKSVNMKVKADRYAFFTGVRLPWRSRV